MTISFEKYHGAGNDFILLDNRTEQYNQLTSANIADLCHRRFGIGADGLMMLNSHPNYDFAMRYFNSDGKESTLCGNGGRCITAFAKRLKLIQEDANFIAIDGPHRAAVLANGDIRLAMNDVHEVETHETYMALNTGSPHYVCFTDDANDIDVPAEGRLIRNSPKYRDEGINVNFVSEINNNELYVRTYERGVEDETWSCGTGVTAAAMAFAINRQGPQSIRVQTKGGVLNVSFEANAQQFTNVFLSGPAQWVFSGQIEWTLWK